MSLLDDLNYLESAKKNTGGTPCRIASILSSMDKDEATALNRLIDETEVFGSQIAETLRRHGHRVGGAHIQRHRRRLKGLGCSCPTPSKKA